MTKRPNYAFIDSQNLNLGVSNDVVTGQGRVLYRGKKLDFKKFHDYLRTKYNVKKAYLFIGLIPGNNELYTYLQECGYTLILKDVVTYLDGEKWIAKGNVDTDIVLYAAAILANEYDKGIFVSGDGDFTSLYNYLKEKGKLGAILVPNRYRYSRLLNKFRVQLKFVSDLRTLFLAKKPSHKKATKSGGRNKALGLLGRGDNSSVAKRQGPVKTSRHGGKR